MATAQTKDGTPISPNDPVHSRDGASYIFVRCEEDGAGSAHVVVRPEGERYTERYRAHHFGLTVTAG